MGSCMGRWCGLRCGGSGLTRNTPVGGIVLLRRRLAGLPAARLAAIDAALADIMELMEVPDQA